MYRFGGPGVPIGGCKGIIDALESVIAAHGGKIHTETEVSKILVENGKAAGVLVGEEVHKADLVISNLGHVFIIREIQKETGGFTELIPMAFLPYNNPIGEKMIASGKFSTTGLEDLQLIAISRVILHTYVKNIQATCCSVPSKITFPRSYALSGPLQPGSGKG